MAVGLEEQARALLERVVGAGHADVRVGLTLDSAHHDRTEEHYEPAKTALRSEQKSDERATPEGVTVAGVPGAPSNLPDGTAQPAAALGGGATGSARTSWTRNWEVDRVTEHTTTPAGRVSRLSVAILVDGTYKPGAHGSKEYQPRERAELDKLADLVKGAVGFTSERGDFLEIDCAPFVGAENGEAPIAEPVVGRRHLLFIAGAALALVLALACFILVRRSTRKKSGLLPAHIAVRLEGAAAAAALAAGNNVPSLPTAPPDRSALRAQAIGIASTDPATAAIILRGWLSAPSSTVAPRSS
jgi:flagellar M-ring protein FliF